MMGLEQISSDTGVPSWAEMAKHAHYHLAQILAKGHFERMWPWFECGGELEEARSQRLTRYHISHG